jgi:hypothetical protein
VAPLTLAYHARNDDCRRGQQSSVDELPELLSARELLGQLFVRADGVITGQLERHSTDILVSTVDTEADLYDSTRAWRDRALAGILHSGSLVQDERSAKRTEV